VKLHLGLGQDRNGTFFSRTMHNNLPRNFTAAQTQTIFAYRNEYKTNNYSVGLAAPLAGGRVMVAWQSARLGSGAYKTAAEKTSYDRYSAVYTYPFSKRTNLYAAATYGTGYAFANVALTQGIVGTMEQQYPAVEQNRRKFLAASASGAAIGSLPHVAAAATSAQVSYTTALDVHTHLIPIAPERIAKFAGVEWKGQGSTLVLDGRTLGIKSLFQPERLIQWMDQRGVARALVSVPPPVWRQHLPQDQSMAWVRYLNEELLAITQTFSPRLGALYYIPLEHPDAMESMIDGYDDRYEGIALAAGGHPDIVYSAAHYARLWDWMDRKKLFVFMHPGTCSDPRLAVFYLQNLVGNPYETGVAATHLVMAGIPARYPGIRFCLAHAGGIFPALCGRLERGYETKRPGMDMEVERPLQAARRFWCDCIAHHPSALRQCCLVLTGRSQWEFPRKHPFACVLFFQ